MGKILRTKGNLGRRNNLYVEEFAVSVFRRVIRKRGSVAHVRVDSFSRKGRDKGCVVSRKLGDSGFCSCYR